MWIASAERCREIDRRAAVEFGLTPETLIERAGSAAQLVVQELLPEGGRIAIFCGKGNNGADGLALARFLKDQSASVDVLLASEPEELSTDAKLQHSKAMEAGVVSNSPDSAKYRHVINTLGQYDLIVDALLGTAATGEVRGTIRDAILAINKSGVPVLALDVPSGIETDTGQELGESIWALKTITFGLPKPCFFQGTGLEHAGYWDVEQIGFPTELLDEETGIWLSKQEFVRHCLPERHRGGHKGDHGSVLIVAGSKNMPGAAVLAAKAALRSGAGLVTVASIPSVLETVAAHLPEALLLHLPERFGAISPEAAKHLIEYQPRVDSAVFGPGLTTSESVLNLLADVWPRWTIPTVIDADALNAVAEGVPLPACPHLMTPHPGEAARLLKLSTAEVQADRFDAVRMLVNRYGDSVILKGAYSLVATPGCSIVVNPTGNEGMGSGGMGDVLSGVLGTLLAQDLPPRCSAVCGTYWHGLAGDLCAAGLGSFGYLASEVADALPLARAKITQSCDD